MRSCYQVITVNEANARLPNFAWAVQGEVMSALPNSGDYYVQRLRTRFRAPSTGLYRFLLSTDDDGALFAGPDWHVIASVPGFSSHNEFDKLPQQKSAPLWLNQGQLLPLQVVMREGRVADNLDIGVITPDGQQHAPAPLAWFLFPEPLTTWVAPIGVNGTPGAPVRLDDAARGTLSLAGLSYLDQLWLGALALAPWSPAAPRPLAPFFDFSRYTNRTGHFARPKAGYDMVSPDDLPTGYSSSPEAASASFRLFNPAHVPPDFSFLNYQYQLLWPQLQELMGTAMASTLAGSPDLDLLPARPTALQRMPHGPMSYNVAGFF